MESFESKNNEENESIPFHNVIIVSPGFEANEHRSGLYWDTRFRLLAAALDYQNGLSEKIVVGGAKIREMKESFANLMKKELVEKYGIPEEVIETEEYTFDTASQVGWTQKNIKRLGRDVALITDPGQAKHMKALLDGFGLEQVPVLSSEDVIEKLAPRSAHYKKFFEKLHTSPEGIRWEMREELLALFTKLFDPQGRKIRKISRNRLQK